MQSDTGPFHLLSARILERLGADTINIPSDLTVPQVASIRAAITKPIDFYVEALDNIGEFLRYYVIPELIRVAAPIYLKCGLRNSPGVYPSGTHLENTVIALSKERVRRAQIARGRLCRRWAPKTSEYRFPRPLIHHQIAAAGVDCLQASGALLPGSARRPDYLVRTFSGCSVCASLK